MANEPLSPVEARRRARLVLESGRVLVLDHAVQRMGERGMSVIDCENVIRAGRVVDVEFKAGTHRYRFETARMAVVVLFQGPMVLWIVTVWRKE